MYILQLIEIVYQDYFALSIASLYFALLSTAELLGETTVKLERADTPDSIGGYEYMTLGKIGR